MSEQKAEVLKAEYREAHEFEFLANVRVRLYNPNGKDVIAFRTYQARPKYDGLLEHEDHVYVDVEYRWPEVHPSQGGPFWDAYDHWEPSADLNDDDALLKELVEEHATLDPIAELDAIAYSASEQIETKLEN
jgi:hypothetical protein